MPPALPDALEPAPHEGPTRLLEEMEIAPLCTALAAHQMAQRLEAALREVWHHEQAQAEALPSLAEARKALDEAHAELNRLWNQHRAAPLEERPALLGGICAVQSRSDALWARIRELGG